MLTPCDEPVLEGRIDENQRLAAENVAQLRAIISDNIEAIEFELQHGSSIHAKEYLGLIRTAIKVNLDSLEGHVTDLRTNYVQRMRWKDNDIIALQYDMRSLKEELETSQKLLAAAEPLALAHLKGETTSHRINRWIIYLGSATVGVLGGYGLIELWQLINQH